MSSSDTTGSRALWNWRLLLWGGVLTGWLFVPPLASTGAGRPQQHRARQRRILKLRCHRRQRSRRRRLKARRKLTPRKPSRRNTGEDMLAREGTGKSATTRTS